MKILAISLVSFSANLAANDEMKIDIPLELSENLNKTSSVKDASKIFGEHVLQSYRRENVFICGTTFLPTPDEELKNLYERGLVNIVNEFYPTGHVKSYTPIRQLVLNPVRSALYDGYYFVSDKQLKKNKYVKS